MKARILFVEDDPTVLELGRTVLTKLGHQVLTATTGPQAYELACREHPDAIALDVMLPGMNGFEVAKLLKENQSTRNIPIAFVSAKNQSHDIVEGFNSGGALYLTKPFTVNALKTTIESLLQPKPEKPHARH
ncbi:response regulator [Desulfuromonas versatilis]|uniref:Response regulator n=1 Tax=Desulfuromonas versatilis TaxID=2802975 RepID=A0ABN6E028_9BACT|nr:response regulator [Desulfuromonas versatilis]BCR05747.1 response regulator [Desulfuromonas versatilis]